MEVHHITYIVPYLYTPKTNICLYIYLATFENMIFVSLACEMIMNFLINREHIVDGFNYTTIHKFEHLHWQYENINLKNWRIWSDCNNWADSDLYGKEVINRIARFWSFKIDKKFFLRRIE